MHPGPHSCAALWYSGVRVRSKAVPRSASAPLEDSTGASHVAEADVRVEMMKIESDQVWPQFHRDQSPGTARPGCTGATLCWLRGDESRGRPRPSFWQESALLPRLLRESVQARKPAVPVVAVAVPCQSTVQLPFPENGASATGISSRTLDGRVAHPGIPWRTIFWRGAAEVRGGAENNALCYEAQLLSQLKLGDLRVGLLINFNVVRFRDGIVQKVRRL